MCSSMTDSMRENKKTAEEENTKNETTENEKAVCQKISHRILLPVLSVSVVLLGMGWYKEQDIKAFIATFQKNKEVVVPANTETSSELVNQVFPQAGVVLPIEWGNFSEQMMTAGVIDRKKFDDLYAKQGGLTEAEKKLLSKQEGPIVMTWDNSNILLTLLWAFGLGNKNDILEKGPMTDTQYGGAEKFASTGGWNIASGKTMDHYSKHRFVTLTSEEQALVERVSQNIYRPCCGNSTYFPDCNHAMAMLGLLELLAKQNVSEDDMYAVALQVNAYWFSDTYLTLARYFESQGTSWQNIDPKTVLGKEYSSSAGYRSILQKVNPSQNKGGPSCSL